MAVFEFKTKGSLGALVPGLEGIFDLLGQLAGLVGLVRPVLDLIANLLRIQKFVMMAVLGVVMALLGLLGSPTAFIAVILALLASKVLELKDGLLDGGVSIYQYEGTISEMHEHVTTKFQAGLAGSNGGPTEPARALIFFATGNSGWEGLEGFFGELDEEEEEEEAAQPPAIAAFTPASIKPGKILTITGENFGTVAGDISVLFFDAIGLPIPVVPMAVSGFQLTVKVPNGVVTAQVGLTVAGQPTVYTPQVVVILPKDAPVIYAVTPAYGLPGGTITIRGDAFSDEPGGVRVVFPGGFFGLGIDAVPEEGDYAADYVTVTIPEGALTGKLRVRVSGQSDVETPRDFIIQDPVAVGGGGSGPAGGPLPIPTDGSKLIFLKRDKVGGAIPAFRISFGFLETAVELLTGLKTMIDRIAGMAELRRQGLQAMIDYFDNYVKAIEKALADFTKFIARIMSWTTRIAGMLVLGDIHVYKYEGPINQFGATMDPDLAQGLQGSDPQPAHEGPTGQTRALLFICEDDLSWGILTFFTGLG